MDQAHAPDRTAIVTGGAKRIGAAITRALAADGWHVLIHAHQSIAAARALAAEIGHATVVGADLADAACADIVMAAAAGLPPPRLLVNSAARFELDGLDDFTTTGFDAHMATNLRAPALLSRAFAMVAAGDGVIVNLLDAKLAQPNADFFSYTLSKMGLAGLTELTARQLAPHGIRVCGIAPAITLPSGPQSGDNFAAVHRFNPLGIGVEPAHIVAALRFILATPTITGQTVLLDAGQRFLGLDRDVQFLPPSTIRPNGASHDA